MLILLICGVYSQLVYQAEFHTNQTSLAYSLPSLELYSIELLVIEPPKHGNYLPRMIVIVGNNSYYDRDNFQMRSSRQRVYVQNTTNITINVNLVRLFESEPSPVSMDFNISIKQETEIQNESCPFPYYDYGCVHSLNKFEIADYLVTVARNTWMYGYVILSNEDYQLMIDSQLVVGLSLLPLDKPQITILPSFEQLFQLVTEKQIDLKREVAIDDYVFAFGIYNMHEEITLKVQIKSVQQKSISWIYILIAVIAVSIALTAFIVIWYQIRKSIKIMTYEKPALEPDQLNAIAPARLPNNSISESCAICITSFEPQDMIRIPPCKHAFHDNCLQSWTKKQAKCPICRYDLSQKQASPSRISKRGSAVFINLPKSHHMLRSQEGDMTEQSPYNIQSRTQDRFDKQDICIEDK